MRISDWSSDVCSSDLVWQRYLADIGAARGIEPAAIADGIEQLPQRLAAQHGNLGALALSEHLVDGLKTEEQVRDLLIARGVAEDDNRSFRQIDLDTYLGFVNGERPEGRRDGKKGVSTCRSRRYPYT